MTVFFVRKGILFHSNRNIISQDGVLTMVYYVRYAEIDKGCSILSSEDLPETESNNNNK